MKLRIDLIHLLDIDIFGRNNWKILAVRLGYSWQFIKWLERPSCRSPTEELLMEWTNNVKDSPKDVLLILQNHLAEMERDDCVDKIQEHFGQVTVRKETTV